MIELVEYRGWKNNLRITNGMVEMVVTLDVGPRVIAFRRPGGFNVLKNYDEQMGGVGEPDWQIRGGLRIWVAPEDLTRTYFPDNRPVSHQILGSSAARFTPPPEEPYGIQKELEIRLEEAAARATVRVSIKNVGPVSTTLAPWAPTVMAPGGIEIIPLPAKAKHPGHPSRARHPGDYGPNQAYVVWPYLDFTDSRWTFGSRYILLRQDPAKGPTKLGLGHPVPWVAYWNQGTLFVKRFPHHQWATYPDLGTSYQTFSNEDMLEMETVGPLCSLLPGQRAELTETWELLTDVPQPLSEADIDAQIAPRLGG